MEITHIYTNQSGDSNFEDISVFMEEKVEMGFLSHEIEDVKKVHIRNTFFNIKSGPIVVEKKTYMVVLQGRFDIEVSSGEVRTFGPGNVILFDDKSGKGHRAKTYHEMVFGMVIETE